MKKIILFLLIINLSCKKQENKEELKNNTEVINYTSENITKTDSITPNYRYKDLYKMRTDIIKGLKSKGYKIPSTDFFRKKILDVSGVDITKEEYDDPDFGKYQTLAKVIRDLNILLPVDIENYAKVDDQYIDHIINYNNMVIYEQMTAVMLLENFDQGCNIYSYIAGTGYTGNDKFLMKVLGYFQNYSLEEKSKGLEELLLGYTLQGNVIPKGPFRFDMLEKIEKLKPGLMSNFRVSSFSKYNLTKEADDKARAYIYNSLINCKYDDEGVYIGEFGVNGLIDDYFREHPEYLERLKENNYYGLEKLKYYATVIFTTEHDDVLVDYIVNDTDGYTNLREEKNTSSKILEKIKTGEYVGVLDKSGDWWFVKTYRGKNKGYIHKSKLKAY
ncbi:SH3 domain-containing protein [Flavobacterium sp. 316]|uniref:SH3 domain-containing protein n=1 Tax=Flavobacterium sp. 316 TaxID=1603293 RepID=UPI0006971625|nr:SH3 domain-containing protein [Flavobacterium sp. 316]